jgi:hypothetical protein
MPIERRTSGTVNSSPMISRRRWVLISAWRVRYLDFEHTFELAQRVFQAPRIVVIVEPLDDKVRLAGRDPVARALDAHDQIGQPQLGGVKLHTGALG